LPRPSLPCFPSTTLFRSPGRVRRRRGADDGRGRDRGRRCLAALLDAPGGADHPPGRDRAPGGPGAHRPLPAGAQGPGLTRAACSLTRRTLAGPAGPADQTPASTSRARSTSTTRVSTAPLLITPSTPGAFSAPAATPTTSGIRSSSEKVTASTR